MKKSIKMIFFDVDGTLVNIKRAQNKASEVFFFMKGFSERANIKELLKTWSELTRYHYASYCKHECTYEEQRQRRIIDMYSRYGMRVTEEESLHIYDEYLKLFEKFWIPYKDVAGCLDRLDGYKLGIITNGSVAQQKQKLEKTGIAHFFSSIIAANDYVYKKPETGLYEIACAVNSLAPEECVHVGDEKRKDVLPSNAIGMHGIWLKRRQRDPDKDDVMTIRSLFELPEIIKEL